MAFIVWPLLSGLCVMILACIYNTLFWGESLNNPAGYLIPLGVGLGSGLICANWYRRARFHLDESLEQKSQYEKLSHRHELTLHSTGEGIYEVDQDGFCSFVNKAAIEMLGYNEEELLGCTIHYLIGDSLNKPTPLDQCPILNVSKIEKGIRLKDILMSRKDGSVFIAEMSAQPVKDGDGTRVVVLFRDVTEERKLQKRIHYMANFDKITGLQNRYAFEENLKLAIEGVHESNENHLLCYIDLDQFKVINDTIGHSAGDELLKNFSSHLANHICKEDILGRLGGDEFGLLIHDCCAVNASRIVEKLRRQTELFTFHWQDQVFRINLSIGVCLLNWHIKDIAQAMKEADQACLVAKEAGRNRYHIYKPEEDAFRTMDEQMGWVQKIQQAIEENRLYLRYQPIACLQEVSRPQRRFEILVSMLDESGQSLSPGSFLPAAERYDLMPQIDRWVVLNTFDWLENNYAEQSDLDFVAINLSGRSISDDAFLKFVQEELSRRSFVPSQICFEITETAAMQQMHKAVEFIREIKTIGCRLALDDFGSGMASFGYLKNFPVDFIKIDGSFIRDITTNPLSRVIVESIQQVARVMQIAAIAEHAEDRPTLELLQRSGIEYVQGYIVGRPERLCYLEKSMDFHHIA